MCTFNVTEEYGADPAKIKWNVVRGDNASLKVEFLENDEITYYDTSDWSYSATTYDPSGDVLDELEVVEHNGYVEIKADSSITENWGSGYKGVVAELRFDLQVTINSIPKTIWSPVVGTVYVIGDITPGGL